MLFVFSFLSFEIGLDKLQEPLYFYRLNFFLLTFLVAVLLFYVYLQRRTITLLQNANTEKSLKKKSDDEFTLSQKQEKSATKELSEQNISQNTTASAASGLSPKEQENFSLPVELPESFEASVASQAQRDIPLLETTEEAARIIDNDFLHFEREANRIADTPAESSELALLPKKANKNKQSFSVSKSHRSSALASLQNNDSDKDDTIKTSVAANKGNTYLFLLPSDNECKEVVIGNKEGSVPTYKDFIRERHLQISIQEQEGLYRVEIKALGYTVFMLPPKMGGFKRLAEPLVFLLGTNNQFRPDSLFSFFALNEISGRSPLRFRLGDGSNFLEIHFYTYGQLEVKEKQRKNIFKNFYIRIYKVFIQE